MMAILILSLAYAALTVGLYRYLRAKRDSRALWRASVAIGSSVGIARAVLACGGLYGVQHTGGPFQVPAYALAMLALPEAMVFGRPRGSVPPGFYVSLGVVLLTSSLLLVCALTLAIQRSRRQRDS